MAADLQRTIEIIFAGTNNVGDTVRDVGRSIDRFQKKVGGVTGPMADWTKTLISAETALAGVGVAMTGVAVTQAGQFRESVTEIGTLFNGTGDQVEQLQKQILEYSRGSTSSIEDINNAVYLAISTGTDWADAVKYVSDVEVLATAGRESLAAVTDVLSGAMNAYGAATSEAADYSDVLMVTVQKGKTSLPELASSLSGVTSEAAAAKVPFDDVNAALAAITVSGVDTSKAVTRLRALLAELSDPSDELRDALGGVSLETDGLDGVMRQLMDATGGTSEEMYKLFGSNEAVSAALLLANDSAGKYNEALQAMEERTGAALTASEKFAKEFDNINQTLLNRIEAMFVDAGLPILNSYADIVEELGQIFNSVSFSIDKGAFDALYEGIEGGAEKVTELLGGIAEALPEALASINYDGLLSAFGELSDSIGGLFGDLDLTDAEDLKTVIQAVVDGVEALTRVTAGAIDGLGPFIRTLADVIDSVNKGDADIQSLVGSVLGFATGVDALLPSLGGLGNILATVGGGLAVLGGAKQAGAALAGIKGLTLALSGPGALLAVMGAAVYVIADFGLSVADLADEMEKFRKEDERWMDAAAITDNWGDMIIKAKELGADVSHLADVFEETYGITIEQAEGYNSVSAAMDAASQAAKESAKADKEAAEAKNQQVLAASEQTLAEFARKEALEDQAKAEEDHKNAVLNKVKAYQEMTAEEYNLLDVSERQELIDAKRIAQDEGWLDTLGKQKNLKGELLDQSEAEAEALEREVQLRKEAADELFRQTELVFDYQLALEQIQSDERLRIVELEFNMEIEQLKQQGQTARSIIEGINNTITSTGETLSNLAGNLSGFDTTVGSGYRDMMDLVKAEEERRDKALKLQESLTDAQVKQMEAQAKMLNERAEAYARGDAAITVDGQGLQPHLEAFMFELLEEIQVRVNAQGHEMLLGVT